MGLASLQKSLGSWFLLGLPPHEDKMRGRESATQKMGMLEIIYACVYTHTHTHLYMRKK